MHVEHAVVTQNVSPMRAQPTTDAEQVSQAIFGEVVRVLAQDGAYARIQTPDAYEGWIFAEHLVPLTEGDTYPAPTCAAAVASLFLPLLREPSEHAEAITILTLGTMLQVAQRDARSGYCAVSLPGGGTGYVEAAGLMDPPVAPVADTAACLAQAGKKLIGVPYLWGGRTPFGMDCSGFIQRIFFLCGRTIPRDAHDQAGFAAFDAVDLRDVRQGDLLFFGRGEGMDRMGITHVGMCLGDGRFIHSAGSWGVTTTSMDDPHYLAIYRCARRLRSAP